MFIVSLAFLAVFIFACALTHLVLLQTESRDFLEVIRMTPFSVVVSAICFLSVWSVIGLAGFHTYLTSSDQTTNEDIKGSFSSKGGQQSTNPYSRGNICLNCFYILCGPLQPSLIDRWVREFVRETKLLQSLLDVESWLTSTGCKCKRKTRWMECQRRQWLCSRLDQSSLIRWKATIVLR